jgi:thioredoxin-dependent peroxiredoxin
MYAEGSKFPDFSLQDQSGKTHTLNEIQGQKAVVFFYPKDDTSG